MNIDELFQVLSGFSDAKNEKRTLPPEVSKEALAIETQATSRLIMEVIRAAKASFMMDDLLALLGKYGDQERQLKDIIDALEKKLAEAKEKAEQVPYFEAREAQHKLIIARCKKRIAELERDNEEQRKENGVLHVHIETLGDKIKEQTESLEYFRSKHVEATASDIEGAAEFISDLEPVDQVDSESVVPDDTVHVAEPDDPDATVDSDEDTAEK